MIKVLQNKILAEEVKVSGESTIGLPDSLKQRKYKVFTTDDVLVVE